MSQRGSRSVDCHHCRKSCTSSGFGQEQNSVASKQIRRWFRWFRRGEARSPVVVETDHQPTFALVGTPNVGKSALFNTLTGTYVTVSNYPGTTVEISQGSMQLGDQSALVIDTPGLYSLLPITEEERVARDLLLSTPLDFILHVVDAKNLGRMLPLTLQLIEAGMTVILVINMMDEAKQLGLAIHRDALEQELGIPVVLTAAALNSGIQELQARMASYVQANSVSVSC